MINVGKAVAAGKGYLRYKSLPITLRGCFTRRMTAQMTDQVQWQGESFSITAMDGEGLFEAVGAEPISTACYRGYVAHYRIAEGQLVLAELETGSTYDGAYLGVPTEPLFRTMVTYRGLAVPVAFTGRLLIGASRAEIGYLHMGFRPAYGFERVWELEFSEGRLTASHDRSAEIAAVRDRLAGTRPGPAQGEASRDWVERTFSQSFDYSWPNG
jgi:hypothetical protein